MRRVAVLLCVCLVAGLVGHLGSGSAEAAPVCADVVLYGVRGSGETNASAGGFGDTIAAYKRILENRLNGKRSLRSVPIDYPSRPVSDIATNVGRYFDGVTEGTDKLVAAVKEGLDACPSEKIVIAGYSQGALVLNFGMGRFDSRARSRIATMDLFADPLMWGRTTAKRGSSDVNKNGIYQFASPITSETLNSTYLSRTRSWCNFNDPVCSYSKANLLFHVDVHTDSYKSLSALSAGNAAADVLLADYREPPKPAGTGGATDLMFAIDTTGSMGDDIASVKAQASNILERLRTGSTSARAGLVVYKDDGDEYVAKTLVGLTADLTSVNAAIQSLDVNGGGDTPEAVNSGVITAIRQAWRDGVKKAVILMGDAPGKDPEPVTGYTIADVRRESLAVDPAIVFPIPTKQVPETEAYFQALAEATGGTVFPVTSGDVAAAVAAAVSEISAAPTAVLTVDLAMSGGTTTFSGAGSSPGSSPIATYEWDLDGDGAYEQTTETSQVTTVYTGPLSILAGLRVTDSAGRTALATLPITVDAPAAQPMTAEPLVPEVTTDACGQLLAWSPPTPPEGTRWNATIVDADGRTVGSVEDGSARWRVPVALSPAGLRVRLIAVGVTTESSPNDTTCTVTSAKDRVDLSLRGGRPYSVAGDVTGGVLSVTRDPDGRLGSAVGDVLVDNGPASATQVTVSTWRLLRWTVGFISVNDPIADVQAIAVVARGAPKVSGTVPESVVTLRGRALVRSGTDLSQGSITLTLTDRGV